MLLHSVPVLAVDEPPASTSPVPAPSSAGPSLGARAGWAVPLGNLVRGDSLHSNYDGMVPVELYTGWRIDRNWYVGSYFQYGLLSVSREICPSVLSCSAHDVRFGADGELHFLPPRATTGSFDPWMSLGFGYEVLTISLAIAGNRSTESYRGFELARIGVGIDYLVSDRTRLGTFLGMSAGEFATVQRTGSLAPGNYSIPRTSFHGWMLLGIRMRYDL